MAYNLSSEVTSDKLRSTCTSYMYLASESVIAKYILGSIPELRPGRVFCGKFHFFHVVLQLAFRFVVKQALTTFGQTYYAIKTYHNNTMI